MIKLCASYSLGLQIMFTPLTSCKSCSEKQFVSNRKTGSAVKYRAPRLNDFLNTASVRSTDELPPQEIYCIFKHGEEKFYARSSGKAVSYIIELLGFVRWMAWKRERAEGSPP